jgi:AraC-like DNA-binding protein
MSRSIAEMLMAYSASHPNVDTVTRTAVAGLVVIGGDRTTPLEHAFYEPALIVVIQGAKELMLADATFAYTAGQYLVLSVGLSVLARITEASDRAPYLALGLTLDRTLIHELAHELDAPQATALPAPPRDGSLFVGTLDAAQADAIARIVALLDSPAALRALYASITRELFYWLLTGPDGAAIRRIAALDGHMRRIADAIDAMRGHLADTVPIERLAAIAHMSPSSFHHHFKALTARSPLQYLKEMRLFEARRLMLADGADATRAALAVGYESTSQFSREYARMFGAPPRRDVTGLRAAVG